MQRVQTRNASLGVKGAINYFPSGLMGCSDARYILEAIDAAVSNKPSRPAAILADSSSA